MLKQLKKEEHGFTIIEVLIVLAIAGLIMVMVFVAVPNLQRNQRNTGRRQDASHILTAASNFITNSNGVPPAANTTNEQAILTDAAPFSSFTNLTSGAGTETNLTTNKLIILSGLQTLTAPTGSNSNQAVAVVTKAKCNNNTLGATTNGATQEVAVVYTIEAGSGTAPQLACINN